MANRKTKKQAEEVAEVVTVPVKKVKAKRPSAISKVRKELVLSKAKEEQFFAEAVNQREQKDRLQIEVNKYIGAITKIDKVLPEKPTFWTVLANGIDIIKLIIKLIKDLKRDPQTSLT